MWKQQFELSIPTIFPKKSNPVAGKLFGKYVNLVIELHKYDNNKYYYLNDKKERVSIELNKSDNGKLLKLSGVIGREFYLELYN